MFPTVIEVDQNDPADITIWCGRGATAYSEQGKNFLLCGVPDLKSIIVNVMNLDIIKYGFDKDKDNMVNNY